MLIVKYYTNLITITQRKYDSIAFTFGFYDSLLVFGDRVG